MIEKLGPNNYPFNKWFLYQEWLNVVFIHYEVDADILAPLVKPLKLDLFKNKAYASVVIFNSEKTYPRHLFPIPAISDFPEVNIRTYIDLNGKKGIFFLCMEAGKMIPSFLARQVSKLPYEYSKLKVQKGYAHNENTKSNNFLNLEYETCEPLNRKTDLDLWLTERYSIFQMVSNELLIYHAYHQQWPLKHVNLQELELKYHDFPYLQNYTLVHFSEGVQVLLYK